MSKILIGGGSGFIGQRLTGLFKCFGYNVEIISRMPGVDHIDWNDIEKNGLPKDTSAVINLAGQNVLDPTRRWTVGFKQNVFNSRVNTTALLAKAIQSAQKKPDVFISIHGVSLYKPDDAKVYTEDDKGEDYDFLSNLCIHWERAATIPPEIQVRSVKIRTGVVLGREGGMIKSLYLPFFFGAGGPVASGKQPLPWIHVDDLCSLILFAVENKKVNGILNGVAPDIITNAQFAKSFGKALKRPALIPLPEFVVNLIFQEERAKLLTTGPKVSPKRTLETGFKFEFPEIDLACKDCSDLFVH